MDADAAVKLVQKAGNKEFKEVKEFKEKTNDCTGDGLMWTLTRLSSWCRRQATAKPQVKRQGMTSNKEFKEVKEIKEKTNDCTPVRLMWTLTRLSS